MSANNKNCQVIWFQFNYQPITVYSHFKLGFFCITLVFRSFLNLHLRVYHFLLTFVFIKYDRSKWRRINKNHQVVLIGLVSICVVVVVVELAQFASRSFSSEKEPKDTISKYQIVYLIWAFVVFSNANAVILQFCRCEYA